MLGKRARALAGVTGMLLVTSIGWSSAAMAATPTRAGAPKATSLVSVKAHRLASVPVKAHRAVSFTVLGVAGVPKTGVAAVVLKVAASKPAAAGSLVAYPAGAKRPSVLSVSFAARHSASSTVVVTPGSKGRATLANLSSGTVRVIPTVVGYYRKATSVSAALTYFKAVKPRTAVTAKLASRGAVAVTATGHGVPARGIAGVVVEVTELSAAKSGKVTVSPSGSAASKVTALSFKAGIAATNLVTAQPGSKGRIVVRSSAKGAVRVRVDVVGYLIALAPAGGAPGPVAVTPHAGGAALTWAAAATDAGSPVLHYSVVVTETAPASSSHTLVTTGAVTAFDVTGLAAGGTYTFQVFAVTREGASAPSPVSAPVTLASPAAPTSVVATSAAPGSVTVSWAPAANAGPAITGYTVVGAHSGSVTVGPTTTSHTFTGLTVGQTFVATVTATNAIGTSAASAPSAAVLVAGATGSNATTAVSVDTAGVYHPSPATGSASSSADGSFVVFSHPSALDGTDNNGADDVFLRHAGQTTVISVPQGTTTTVLGASTDPKITPDGHWVVFDSAAALVPTDTNSRTDVYLYDTTTGALSLVSGAADGISNGDKDSLDPVISDNGQYVAFLSNSTNLTAAVTPPSGHFHYVYVRDLTAGTTALVSAAVGGDYLAADASGPSISGDGNLIGYSYAGSDAVAGDTNGAADAFVDNRTSATTTRVSTAANGAEANFGSGAPQLSDNGQYAVFQSDATNLVAGDTNGASDVFEKNLATGAITRVSVGNDGSQASSGSTTPFVSADGNRIEFTSAATNLVSGDTNAQTDAFVRVVSTGETLRVSLGAGAAQLPSGASGSGLSGNGIVALFTSADPIAGASSTTDAFAVADVFARTLG
jgi:hypothetical protein